MDTGFRHDGWLVPYFDERFLTLMTEWTMRAAAFLLGNKTYETFAASWPKGEVEVGQEALTADDAAER